MRRLVLFCLVFTGQIQLALSLCNAVTDATVYASERTANGVELKFYRVQTDEWNEQGSTDKVVAEVIKHANSYCAGNSATCGLQSCCSSAFKETDVVVSSGYPENSLKDMLLKISLDFPADLNSTGDPQCVMGKSALQIVIEEAREDIHTATGYWITYIDDEFYGIPPPSELNKIIIPIAFAVILGLIILTIALNFWNKRKEESLRRKKIIEQRKKSKMAKESPVYNVDTKEPRPPSSIGKKNKDQLYKDNLKQSTLSSKKTGSIASEDSAIKVDTVDSRHRQAFAYEKELNGASGYEGYERKGGFAEPEAPPSSHLKPIDSGADEETRSPEKKKKKKKKRSKSKEVMEGLNNEGYSNADGNEAYE